MIFRNMINICDRCGRVASEIAEADIYADPVNVPLVGWAMTYRKTDGNDGQLWCPECRAKALADPDEAYEIA